MSKILVAGSVAYDHVMRYDGLFKNVILPDQLDHLSVAFTASKKSVNFGGCAGNIAYTLRLFGEQPVVLAAVGSDFERYEQWMKKCGIDTSTLVHHEDELTASATIITDQGQNQITIFHGGAMTANSKVLSVRGFGGENGGGGGEGGDVGLAIIAPDDPARMMRLARECAELNIPYIFDPAQALTALQADDLRMALGSAKILIANEYEVGLICKILGIERDRLAGLVPIFIETFGAKGSSVVSPEGTFLVKAVKPEKIVDPTGCGDAFRAGVLYGMSRGLKIEKCCQMGALAATYALEHEGTQGHAFTLEEFEERLKESFVEGI